MRKIITCCFLAAGFSAYGQAFADHKIGVTLNGHGSQIHGIHLHSKTRYGAGLGVFTEIPLDAKSGDVRNANKFFFVPQLEFSMDGENNNPNTGKQKYHAEFISLPLYFKYYFPFGSTADDAVFLQLGPQFGFAVASKASGPDDMNSSENGYKVNFVQHHNDNFKKFNIGASVAVGYRMTENWQAFVRYDHGFTKAYDNNPGGEKTYHYKLGAGLSYIFN